jgi:ankyrin repeat protein
MAGSHVPFGLLRSARLGETFKGLRRLLGAHYLMQDVFKIQDEPLKVPLKVLFDEAGVMEFLIHDKGLDPNQCNAGGRTCLSYAAELGLKSQLEFLLEQNGLDVNAADSAGDTALHHAASNGHEDIVGMLLGHPNLDVNKQEENGWTALHDAVYSGIPGVLKVLLKQEDLTTIGGTETWAETTDSATNDGDNGRLNQNINPRVMDPRVSLSGTDLARTEKLAQISRLNRREIDVNATDHMGRTALHLAAQKKTVRGWWKCSSDAPISTSILRTIKAKPLWKLDDVGCRIDLSSRNPRGKLLRKLWVC